MRFIRQAELAAYDQWDKLPKALQGMDTRVLYISPDGVMFHLYGGPNAGRQGVHLAEDFAGDYLWPFELLLTEGAYELGATIERVNVLKREITLHITIGNHKPPLTNYQYRMAENRWWDGQDENRDGWLGIYTRFSGWRWLKVRPAKTVATGQTRDPVAFDNNVATYEVSWIAQRPYYTKPSLFTTWKAADTPGVLEARVPMANRGDIKSHVQYLVSGAGTVSVQDGNSGRMVQLPPITKNDGYVLVDTDPNARTLTATNDPVDNAFYKLARASKILDFFLHDTAVTGLPIWKRFDKRFMASIPPKSVATLRVTHTNPNGSITVLVPQRYKRSR